MKSLVVVGLLVGKYGYGELDRGKEYKLHGALANNFGYTEPVGELGEFLMVVHGNNVPEVDEVKEVIDNPPMKDKFNIDYKEAISQLQAKGWDIFEVADTTDIDLNEYHVSRILQ